MIQLILFISGNIFEQSSISSHGDKNYEIPFCRNNILSIFTSENVDIDFNPFPLKTTNWTFIMFSNKIAQNVNNIPNTIENVQIDNSTPELTLNLKLDATETELHSEMLSFSIHSRERLKISAYIPAKSHSLDKYQCKCYKSRSLSFLKSFQWQQQSHTQVKYTNKCCQCFIWCNFKNVNKICHILYGNRTNLGYKYFSWNCDRALISQNKIEDIKITANRHKPHFMGIAEVDLRRNENNSDDNNNNEMSTEQLFDKFKIEGYKIILPNSWIKHDKARIFVYVNDELNIKVINLKDNESHLQSIVIEVGFGRSKTHIFNYYYREWKSCVTGLNDLASQKSYQ